MGAKGFKMNDLTFPKSQSIPLPLLTLLSQLQRPKANGPRVTPAVGQMDEISRLWGPQSEMPWEQEVGRRWLDMLLGKAPQGSGMQYGVNYPENRSMFDAVGPDVMQMVMEAGISPQEFMQMLMR